MQNLTTSIRRVIVHRNGALVVRTGVASESAVQVLGLPLLFSSDSLRVRTARGSVLDLRETARLVRDGGTTEAPSGELIQQALLVERLTQREQSLSALINALEAVQPAEVKELKELAVRALPSVPGWLAVHQDVTEHLRILDGERASLRLQLKAAQRRVEELRMLTRADPKPPRFTRGFSFLLAGAVGDVPVEIEYFVEAARWVPTYALHLDGMKATLTARALVAQASGEDWNDAELAFSTSDLTRDATLPELQSWRMGRAQPPSRPAFRPLPDDLGSLFRDYDNATSGRTPTSSADQPPPPPPPPPAAPVLMDALEMEGAADGATPARARRSEAPKSKAMIGFGGGAPPAPAAMPAPAPLMQAMRTGAAVSVVTKTAELPPRLRYAYLRLAGADDSHRGTLQPLDVLGHLKQLVDAHDADDVNALSRAVESLHKLARSLRHAPMPPGTVSLDGCHFHHVYEAPGRHSLPSDGAYHGVGIRRDEGPASLEHRTVPRESLDVFRYAILRPTTVPYPAGPMHVYQDGSYRVTSRMPDRSHTRSVELNLGIDPDVRVLERVVHVNQEEKGLVGQTTRVEHKVRFQLLATAQGPVKLVAYDRLPSLREHETEISVSLLSSTPEPVQRDRWLDGAALNGGLEWTVQLLPNEKQDVSWHYAITLPAKSELVGGNRRE